MCSDSVGCGRRFDCTDSGSGVNLYCLQMQNPAPFGTSFRAIHGPMTCGLVFGYRKFPLVNYASRNEDHKKLSRDATNWPGQMDDGIWNDVAELEFLDRARVFPLVLKDRRTDRERECCRMAAFFPETTHTTADLRTYSILQWSIIYTTPKGLPKKIV